MLDKPFFSIVTAALNNGNTIAGNLESVRSQSLASLKHIVIDGGSTDDTLSYLKRYEGLYPLRWISEPDRGIADAINKGITLATGRYLLVLQADDALIDPTVLNRVHKLIRNERYDICSFPVIRERPGSSPFLYRPIKVPGWYHFKFTIPHQGAFVHRRLFERIGGFREEFSIAMDYDFFYRAFAAKASLRFFSRPVSRMGGCGISSNRNHLLKRLHEERRVQNLNENNPMWRVGQKVFRFLYIPYKTRFLSWHKPSCVRVKPPSSS
jgi:glycosyltransferase involved in cell wall biosynthesis